MSKVVLGKPILENPELPMVRTQSIHWLRFCPRVGLVANLAVAKNVSNDSLV